jgi:archaellum component FlaF (FlaF/FlaG flagellin family)
MGANEGYNTSPTTKVGGDAIVNVTIVNVGSTTINVPTTSVLLNATGTTVRLERASHGVIGGRLVLEPGKTTTLVFRFTGR